MSKLLHEQIQRFLAKEVSINLFVDQYIDGWRRERDSGELLVDNPETSELLSSAFCIVDLYNPNDDREEYEFDEMRLRSELSRLLESLSTI